MGHSHGVRVAFSPSDGGGACGRPAPHCKIIMAHGMIIAASHSAMIGAGASVHRVSLKPEFGVGGVEPAAAAAALQAISSRAFPRRAVTVAAGHMPTVTGGEEPEARGGPGPGANGWWPCNP
jgi:hypothetical protein